MKSHMHLRKNSASELTQSHIVAIFTPKKKPPQAQISISFLVLKNALLYHCVCRIRQSMIYVQNAKIINEDRKIRVNFPYDSICTLVAKNYKKNTVRFFLFSNLGITWFSNFRILSSSCSIFSIFHFLILGFVFFPYNFLIFLYLIIPPALCFRIFEFYYFTIRLIYHVFSFSLISEVLISRHSRENSATFNFHVIGAFSLNLKPVS